MTYPYLNFKDVLSWLFKVDVNTYPFPEFNAIFSVSKKGLLQ